MSRIQCPKCQMKSPKQGPVLRVGSGEYVRSLECRRRNCQHKWEISVAEWIASRIGEDVSFKPPAEKKGILKDRAVIENPPYWDVVDLIHFEGDEEPDWLRISYYFKSPKGRLTWGGQTSITEPISVWKRIFLQASREKKWFREILTGVMKDLQK